jgi:dienelactone hydrolase
MSSGQIDQQCLRGVRRRFLRGALIAVCATVLVACVNRRIHTPYVPQPTALPVSYAPRAEQTFRYTRTSIEPQNATLSELRTDRLRVRLLKFRSIGVNGQDGNLVTARYYQSPRPGKHKLVIVLPIWGSYNYPPDRITEGILARGDDDINVLRVLGEQSLIDWARLGAATDEESFQLAVTDAVSRVRTMVIDVRRLIDWAETQPDIDSRRIGLIGFSLGAQIAGLIISNEPRVAVGVLVMGGANPHEILTECAGQPQIVRENILPRLEWSERQYQDTLEQLFEPVNPAQYRGRPDPARVIMFDAYYDDCIPRSAREALWTAMGRPERISFLYTHKMSFLAMTPLGSNYMRREIYEFLDKAL